MSCPARRRPLHALGLKVEVNLLGSSAARYQFPRQKTKPNQLEAITSWEAPPGLAGAGDDTSIV